MKGGGVRLTDRRPGVRLRGAAGAVLVALAASACVGRDAPADAADEVPAAPTALGEAPADVPHLSVRLLEVVRVSEGAIEVRFSVRCEADTPAPVPIAELFASAAADAGAVADVFAIDETAGKKYFVVRDADRRPVGSRDLDAIAPGATRALWTRIGAPPPGVATVTIQVPHAPPFSGVPVTGPPAVSGRPPGEPLPPPGRM